MRHCDIAFLLSVTDIPSHCQPGAVAQPASQPSVSQSAICQSGCQSVSTSRSVHFQSLSWGPSGSCQANNHH
eukprot:1280145-Prorocentrum_lima.AAC.1